jgi:predicted esterase
VPVHASFNQLNAETMRRRAAGDRLGALDLLGEHEGRFPRQAGLVRILRVEILAELGRADEAVGLLSDALDRGFRYRGRWLRDARFRALAADDRFAALVERADRQYDAAQAHARSELRVFAPEGDAPERGWPVLVALHGNNSDLAETAAYWQAAVRAGWLLALPQSSEIGVTPGVFVWNDGQRAAAELDRRLIEVRASFPTDGVRTVIAGFSMGARQALELVLGGRVPAAGVIAIGAWLPDPERLAETVRPDVVRGVRTYVIVGTRDDSGYEGSRTLVDRLRSYGGIAEIEIHDGGHDYPAAIDAILQRVLRDL